MLIHFIEMEKSNQEVIIAQEWIVRFNGEIIRTEKKIQNDLDEHKNNLIDIDNIDN